MRLIAPDARALDATETLGLFRLWREEGEEHRRAEIIEGNVGLAMYLVGLFRRPDDPPSEDLFGEGMVALIEAVDQFDLGRGFRFSTLASKKIRHALHACRRRYRSAGVEIDDLDQIAGPDHADEPANATAHAWEAESILAGLAPVDQAIVVLRFGLRGVEPMTLEAIGEKLAVSGGFILTRIRRITADVRVERLGLRESA